MKLRRFLAAIGTVLMLMTAAAIPASAATAYQHLTARINGGATVSSNVAEKTTTGLFAYTASPSTSDGWNSNGSEWVYIRGRSSGGSQATGLAHRNYYGYVVSGTLPYLSGFGSLNSYYKIAIEYDNDNPYEYVNLHMIWTP